MNIKQDFLKTLKKIDFKDRRYVLPAIAFPFVIIFAYQIYGLFENDNDLNDKVVTSELNEDLPDIADENGELSRADIMKRTWNRGDDYSALDGVEVEQENELSSKESYTDSEKQKLDSVERERKLRDEQIRKLRESLAYNYDNNRNNRSNSSSYNSGSASYSQPNGATTAAADYAKEVKRIQKQLLSNNDDEDEEEYGDRRSKGRDRESLNPLEKMELETLRKEKAEQQETKIVKVAEDKQEKFFHSVKEDEIDDNLIKAMIDQTIKVQDGTRIRLKLLKNVTIDSIKLEKGTYLYALVRGFSGQRVMANVTNILVKDKFIKVNLSLYDLDGMEGFYVPASAFREMVKNVGSNAISGANMQMNNGVNNSMSGEYIALQAIQQAYSGVTQAISSNIRKNRAKIKYNTVVYLINSNGF